MMLFEEFEGPWSWSLYQPGPGPTLPSFDHHGVPVLVSFRLDLGSHRYQLLHLMKVYPRL
jgi:hypothetical protein